MRPRPVKTAPAQAGPGRGGATAIEPPLRGGRTAGPGRVPGALDLRAGGRAMATQVIEVRDAVGGCAVRFVPEGDEPAARLRERCAGRGWQAGEAAASADPAFQALSVAVRGATAAQLRAELEGDPAFDLSCC